MGRLQEFWVILFVWYDLFCILLVCTHAHTTSISSILNTLYMLVASTSIHPSMVFHQNPSLTYPSISLVYPQLWLTGISNLTCPKNLLVFPHLRTSPASFLSQRSISYHWGSSSLNHSHLYFIDLLTIPPKCPKYIHFISIVVTRGTKKGKNLFGVT